MTAVDEDKVKSRVAAREAAGEWLAMLLEESASICHEHGADAGATFLVELLESLRAILPDGDAQDVDDDKEPWSEAVAFCDEISKDIERVWESRNSAAAADFLQSVEQTVDGIREGVMRVQRVTLAQQQALQNIHRGVLKWI